MDAAVSVEYENFRNGYWSRFTPAGVPVPGFLVALKAGHEFPEYVMKKFDSAGPQYRVLMALELEHREKGICTLADLENALDLIGSSDYDWSRVESLSAAVQDALWITIRDDNRLALESAGKFDDGKRFERELRAKDLPPGSKANLAMIRTILKRP